MTLRLANREAPRKILARIARTVNNIMVSTAGNVATGGFCAEGQLWVAVDGDEDKVRDGDCFGNGEAGEKGGSGELHIGGWLVLW